MSDAGSPAKAAFVIPNPKAKLLDQVREVLRVKHYAFAHGRNVLHWITRLLKFHRHRRIRETGAAEITVFLSHLASTQHVAAATQNQAFTPVHPRCPPRLCVSAVGYLGESGTRRSVVPPRE
jgi:hypothetical protein